MKILITGGAGFIGSNAANTFSQQGHSVTVIDNFSLGVPENLEPDILCIEGDVRDMSVLKKADAPDIIIHLAASSSSPMFTADLSGALSNNILGHVAVLEYAAEVKAKKVLFASTSSVYANNPVPLKETQEVMPTNFYAVSKYAQENISRVFSALHGMPIIAFRFMSVYGPHEEHKGAFANLVSQFIWGMEEGKSPVIYGDGTQTRDFTSVHDLVSAFELAITADISGFEIFNVGTSEAVSVRDLVDIINAERGAVIPATFVENPIPSGYIQNQQADLSKISTILGYTPRVSLQAGIRELIALRKENPIQPKGLSF